MTLVSTNSPIQVPIISGVPVRLGVYPVPFTLVNTSDSATVWVGDDSSVTSGVGIALSPRASMRCFPNSEKWAALGNDIASVGQVAIIIISFTIDQFSDPFATALAILNSGIIVVDNPVSLLQTTVIASTNLPGIGQFIDVSTYQSIYWTWIPGGNPLHGATIIFQWFADDSGSLQSSCGEDMFVWSSGDTQDKDGWQLPVRGKLLHIIVNITGAAPNDAISVIGSHRPYVAASNTPENRILASLSNPGLAAGTTIQQTLAYHYDGPAVLTAYAFAVAGAAIQLEVNVNDLTTNLRAFTNIFQGLVAGGVARTFGTFSFVIPRNSCQIQLSNPNAIAINVATQVHAAPEGT